MSAPGSQPEFWDPQAHLLVTMVLNYENEAEKEAIFLYIPRARPQKGKFGS